MPRSVTPESVPQTRRAIETYFKVVVEGSDKDRNKGRPIAFQKLVECDLRTLQTILEDVKGDKAEMVDLNGKRFGRERVQHLLEAAIAAGRLDPTSETGASEHDWLSVAKLEVDDGLKFTRKGSGIALEWSGLAPTQLVEFADRVGRIRSREAHIGMLPERIGKILIDGELALRKEAEQKRNERTDQRGQEESEKASAEETLRQINAGAE